jgi:hypothetical protein
MNIPFGTVISQSGLAIDAVRHSLARHSVVLIWIGPLLG